MTPQQFIETAIEGGYEPFKTCKMKDLDCKIIDFQTFACNIKPVNGAQAIGICSINIYRIFLDPKAWQAVGKVKGWDWEGNTTKHSDIQLPPGTEAWKYRMYRMISVLIEGQTLEEYLATLN